MIGHLCYTAGKSDPTLVLDRRAMPADERVLINTLLVARDWLADHYAADVTTIAMIEPSADPNSDLDHLFAQYVPGTLPRFALRGSCGNSILSSVAVAHRLAWLPRLTEGRRWHVNVLNTGDRVACEVSGTSRTAAFAVEFAYDPLADCVTCCPPERRRPSSRAYRCPWCPCGNPYVFVDAAELGLPDQEALFAAGSAVRERLAGIRRAAAGRLGLPESSVLPKIAAVGQYQYRRLAVLTLPAPVPSAPIA